MAAGLAGTVLLAIAFVGGLVELLTGIVLPVYGQLGMAISRFTDAFGEFFGRVYLLIERGLIWLAEGWRRPVMGVALLSLLGIGVYYQSKLKVGDTTPGAALLYPSHPYNVAFTKVNQKFTGASQLVIIAEGAAFCTVSGQPCEGEHCTRCELGGGDGVHGTRETCVQREGRHQGRRHAQQPRPVRALHGAAARGRRHGDGGVATQEDLPDVPRGRPKWEMLPTRNDHIAQLFFLLTSNTRRGEMDRFFDADYKTATVAIFYKDYTHETIRSSIERAKEYIAAHQAEAPNVTYRLAGGLIGILAAVNEEVEWSYRVNLLLILVVVFLLSYATYVSVVGAFIVMLPSLVAQPLSEAVMYLLGIDFNINSLPVAAVGIGIGIDYGYYVLSRIVEELKAGDGDGFDTAIRRMFETTGKTVLFTGRVADRQHHLLGVLPDEVPGRHGAAAGAAARLPPDGRADVHPAHGGAVQAAVRHPLRRGAAADPCRGGRRRGDGRPRERRRPLAGARRLSRVRPRFPSGPAAPPRDARRGCVRTRRRYRRADAAAQAGASRPRRSAWSTWWPAARHRSSDVPSIARRGRRDGSRCTRARLAPPLRRCRRRASGRHAGSRLRRQAVLEGDAQRIQRERQPERVPEVPAA